MFSIPPKSPFRKEDLEKLKQNSLKIKEQIENAAETADNVAKEVITTIENSSVPQAKKMAEFIKAHEDAAASLRENIKTGMDYAAHNAYKKAEKAGTEIAKVVIKEKVKNKFFNNKFFQTIFTFFKKIKKAISLPKKF